MQDRHSKTTKERMSSTFSLSRQYHDLLFLFRDINYDFVKTRKGQNEANDYDWGKRGVAPSKSIRFDCLYRCCKLESCEMGMMEA